MRRFTGGQMVPRPTRDKTSASSNEMSSRRNREVMDTINRRRNPQTARSVDTYENINPEINRILYDDLIYFFKPEDIGGKGWTPNSNNPELVETLSLYNIINGNPRGSIPRFPQDSGVPVFNSTADRQTRVDSLSDAPVYNKSESVADLPISTPSIGGKRRSKKTRRFRR